MDFTKVIFRPILTHLKLIGRLFTVLYFSIEIERLCVSACIFHECQNYLWSKGAIIPDARPLGTFENQDGRH